MECDEHLYFFHTVFSEKIILQYYRYHVCISKLVHKAPTSSSTPNTVPSPHEKETRFATIVDPQEVVVTHLAKICHLSSTRFEVLITVVVEMGRFTWTGQNKCFSL